MTVGKDVSSLLADVVKNGQTANLELKKLVYLYLINYAKSQPDLAILAVNTFVKARPDCSFCELQVAESFVEQDSQDPNPLIRALAVRTMGCIRVDKITEYLCDPLARTLRDEDPYVRKTAAVCVAKLYDINPELVEDRGFLDALRELLGDPNPMVVANAVAALSEIADASGRKDVLPLSTAVLYKLLAALNECTEWGQVVILDALAGYSAPGAAEAEGVVERVVPRLQHANCAVVLSAVKVVLHQLPLLSGNVELLAGLRKKLAPPLITLLSAEPEVQYVALRNLSVIIQRYPSILGSEIKAFFCKYNDPLYVKMEKLELLVRLVSERNIDAVLLEWREYATEVDVDFVRKAVRCIGRAAIALEAAAERCVAVLLELIQTKVNYVVQEAVVVIRDIFRRYPGRYEAVIGQLCECLDTLDEPEAKASMIWIVGEYCERIDNAEELLTLFAEPFDEEPPAVQLSLLTAAVKLFLKKPEPGPQALITGLLARATGETDDPDLRDRAFIYWRLLSSDPEAARDVVLAEKPVIADDSASLEPQLLDELLGQLATLASVYHKPAGSFTSRARPAARAVEEDEPPHHTPPPPPPPPPMAGADLLGDLMGSPAPPPPPASAAPRANDLLGDLMGLGLGAPPAAAAAAPPLPLVLASSPTSLGLEVRAALTRSAAGPALSLSLRNAGGAGPPLSGFLIQLNRNPLGLAPTEQALACAPCAPGAVSLCTVPLHCAGPVSPPPAQPPFVLNVAVKSPLSPPPGVLYFNVPLSAEALFTPPQPTDAASLAAAWRALPEGAVRLARAATIASPESAASLLRAGNVAHVHTRQLADGSMALYCSASLPPAHSLVVELTARPGAPGVRVAVRCASEDAAALAAEAVERLLSA